MLKKEQKRDVKNKPTVWVMKKEMDRVSTELERI